MSANDIKFLPVEFEDRALSLKEPYSKNILGYLDRKKIQFKQMESKVVIPAINIQENDLDNIIKLVRDCRDKKVQRDILKHYL